MYINLFKINSLYIKCTKFYWKLYFPICFFSRLKCDILTNKRIELKIQTQIKNCQCQTKSFKRICPCDCPKNKFIFTCDPQNGITTHRKLFYSRGSNQCTCLKRLVVRKSKIDCPNNLKLIKNGTCLHHPDENFEGDLYRKEIWSKIEQQGCNCENKSIVKMVPCRKSNLIIFYLNFISFYLFNLLFA